MTFVGVCGGRDYADKIVVVATIMALVQEFGARFAIVHGGAPGADTLAGDAAAFAGINVVVVPALWHVHGKGAGHRRNAVIAELPLARLIAFPGGVGTANMVSRARAKGIPVVEIPK